MDSSLRKLVSIAGDPLGPPLRVEEADITEACGALGEQLFVTLCEKNGFYAFEAALHVFPVAQGSQLPGSLEEWNEPSVWKTSYGRLITQPLLCFAEDVFGGQFCLTDGGVLRFDPETGDVKSIALDLNAWAEIILNDYPLQTGYPLAHAWQLANGPLPAGTRLLPKKPFVIGGAFAVDNLFAMDAAPGMRLRGEIAQQIAALPDGTEIEIEYS